MGTLFVVGVLGAIMPAADAFLSAAASHIVVDSYQQKTKKAAHVLEDLCSGCRAACSSDLLRDANEN